MRFPVFVVTRMPPRDTMAATNLWLGLEPLVETPLVLYPARSTSGLYALRGLSYFIAASDPVGVSPVQLLEILIIQATFYQVTNEGVRNSIGWERCRNGRLGQCCWPVRLSLAGLVGIAAFVTVLPRNANTSPLAALFALLWSGGYVAGAILTWRRSRLAPLSFVAAIGLLLFPASFLFPGSQLAIPSFIGVVLIGVLG
jgi:hypothetical protein